MKRVTLCGMKEPEHEAPIHSQPRPANYLLMMKKLKYHLMGPLDPYPKGPKYMTIKVFRDSVLGIVILFWVDILQWGTGTVRVNQGWVGAAVFECGLSQGPGEAQM